jgi:hypothetical protein
MAWQLIYTSAPRLLEAGRSGFGTVARHRQISPLVVSACERASQFARLPGLDADRSVLAHRIVAAGGENFHVLSSIRDAGADHTRRTNHLAHHLIIEEREIAHLRAPAPSPADILLAMPWISAWHQAPRWFDAADKVDLAGFAQRAGEGAWARLTGQGAHARLLVEIQNGRGAWLVVPPTNVCALFSESLRLIPERAWRVRFTTSLQPSDETADFDWIAIEAGSPLRSQGATSGRLVLDLTAPETLPSFEPPPAAARPAAPAARATPRVGNAPAHATPAAADPFSDYQPTRALPRRTLVIAGAVAALLLVGAVLLLPWYRARQEDERQRREIVNALASTGLFDTEKTRAEFAAELKRVRPENLPRARAFAEETAQLAAMLNKPDFAALRRAPVRPKLQTLAEEIGLNLPFEVGTIAMQLDYAATLQGWLQQFPATKGGDAEYEEASRCGQNVATLGTGASAEMARAFEKVREPLQVLAAQKQATALRALLNAPQRPSRDLSWFRTEQQKLRAADEGAPELRVISELLDDWAAIQNGTPDDVQNRSTLRGKEWPTWLSAEARTKIPNAPPAERVGVTKPAPASSPAPTKSGAPLYVVREIAGLKDFRIPELTTGLSYFIRASFDSDAIELLNPGGRGNLRRRDRVNSDAAFRVNDTERTITPEPGSAEFTPPFILLARNVDGAEVVRLWIVPPSDQPLLPKPRAKTPARPGEGLTREGDKLRVEADALGLPGPFKNPLRLRLPESWAVPGIRTESIEIKNWVADVSGLRNVVNGAQKKLRAEIESLQQTADPKDAKPNAAFHAQGKKVLDAAGLSVGKSPKDRDAALRLGDRSAPLFQQCGSYIDAVCSSAIFPRVEVLSKAGTNLLQLDPAASVTAQAAAIEKALQAVRSAQNELRDAKLRERYAQMLRELEALIEMAQPDSPAGLTRPLDAGTQGKARLLAAKEELKRVGAHPVLGSALPAGAYRVAAVSEGAEVDLIEIEVAP